MAAKSQLLSTKQVERACVLTKSRARLISDYLTPKAKARKGRHRTYSYISAFERFYVNEEDTHGLPLDLQTKGARYLVEQIDAELATLGVKP